MSNDGDYLKRVSVGEMVVGMIEQGRRRAELASANFGMTPERAALRVVIDAAYAACRANAPWSRPSWQADLFDAAQRAERLLETEG